MDRTVGDSNQVVLGIDTSCYTTSSALVDMQGRVIIESRLPVLVRPGEIGARQSFAVFSHVSNMPTAVEKLCDQAHLNAARIAAVAASTRPLPATSSYLPVFRVSGGYGRALARCLNVPFFEASHQTGHLLTAWPLKRWESHASWALALHLSGGTSQLLKLRKGSSCSPHWLVRVLGDSLDIHAGQFVDRVGKMIGFSFPAGSSLDSIALGWRDSREDNLCGALRIPSATRGLDMSFSGGCSMAKRALERGAPGGEVAAAVFGCIAKTCEKVIMKALRSEREGADVLVVGGVAASKYLRDRLCKRLEYPGSGIRLWFPQMELCTDNAIGVALAGVGQIRFGMRFSPETKEIDPFMSK